MKLIQISSKELMTFLESNGFSLHHSKGSHFIMIKHGIARVVIPYRSELAIGTTLAILQEAGIEREKYLNYFSRKR